MLVFLRRSSTWSNALERILVIPLAQSRMLETCCQSGATLLRADEVIE